MLSSLFAFPRAMPPPTTNIIITFRCHRIVSSVDAFVAYLNRIHEWKIDSILIESDFLHTYSFLFMSRDSKTCTQHNQRDDAVCKSSGCERERSISEFIGFSWMFDDAKRARKTRKISEWSPTSVARQWGAGGGGTGITGDVFPSQTTQTNKCTSITLHTLDVGSCLDVHSLQFPRKDICSSPSPSPSSSSSSWWQSSSLCVESTFNNNNSPFFFYYFSIQFIRSARHIFNEFNFKCVDVVTLGEMISTPLAIFIIILFCIPWDAT